MEEESSKVGELTPPEGVKCESCESFLTDKACVGLYRNCKVIIKPMNYDYMPIVIVVVPMHRHCPIWQLSDKEHNDLNVIVSTIATIMYDELDMFPNFFTGGNINNGKYGLKGVHAHVHIEARIKSDPEYNTFPGHKNKKLLTQSEIDEHIKSWKLYLEKYKNICSGKN